MRTLICTDIYGQTHEAPIDELSWRPSVYGVLIRDNNEVLMAKQYGKYGLPGGGMDFGEQPEDTLVREFKEETGLDVHNPRLQSIQSDLFKPPHSTGGFIQSIQMFYICDLAGGELSKYGFDDHEQQNAELAEWISLDLLDELQTYGTPDFIGEIRKALQVLE